MRTSLERRDLELNKNIQKLHRCLTNGRAGIRCVGVGSYGSIQILFGSVLRWALIAVMKAYCVRLLDIGSCSEGDELVEVPAVVGDIALMLQYMQNLAHTQLPRTLPTIGTRVLMLTQLTIPCLAFCAYSDH